MDSTCHDRQVGGTSRCCCSDESHPSLIVRRRRFEVRHLMALGGAEEEVPRFFSEAFLDLMRV